MATPDFITRISGKMLPAEDQSKLAVRAQKGDKAARETLIKSNIGFCVQAASRWIPLIDFDDGIAIAMDGLNYSLDKFDPKGGASVTTYALNWINARLRRYWQDNSGIVRVPVNRQDKLAKLRAFRDYYLSNNPGAIEVPRKYYKEQLSIDDTLLDIILDLDKYHAVSVDAPVRASASNETDEYTYLDTMHDKDHSSAEDRYVKMQELTALKDAIDVAVSRLKENERAVILHRFLSPEDPYTPALEELAPLFGVTRERIRQIELLGIKKLAKYLGSSRNLQEIYCALRGIRADSEKSRLLELETDEMPPKLTDNKCIMNCGRFLYSRNTTGVCAQCSRIERITLDQGRKSASTGTGTGTNTTATVATAVVVKNTTAKTTYRAPKVRSFSVTSLTDGELLTCTEELVNRLKGKLV